MRKLTAGADGLIAFRTSGMDADLDEQELRMSEDAAMPYHPADDDLPHDGGIQGALAKSQGQLSGRPGVKGMGITQTPGGDDAIIVYVENEQVISQLPSSVDGFAVIGEVTGDISSY